MRAVDLFCGCGGFSLGAKSSGVNVTYAIDAEPRHTEVYRQNHQNHPDVPGVTVETGDVSGLNGDHIRANTGNDSVDIVFGGPPCQGFSVAGNQAPNDPRNRLLFEPLRIAFELDAPYFVIENVPAIATVHGGIFLKELVRRSRELGYEIVQPARILIASNYGVPQRRKRLFLLGYRQGVIPPEYPHLAATTFTSVTVASALAGIPDPVVNDYQQSNPSFRYYLPGSQYARHLERTFRDPLAPNLSIQQRQVRNHWLTCHSHEVIGRFRNLAPGETDPKTRHRRLYRDRPAFTLRAGTASRTALRPVHPVQPRVITVREAARLHSYPDWYQFDQTKHFGYMQVGNSVCPLQAKAVFETFTSL